MDNPLRTVVFSAFGLLFLAGAACPAQTENPKTKYPAMAPLDQYLMDREEEIKLARTAAPESISKDAEIWVLGKRGYETAVGGKNGFVCLIQRSWTAPSDDPDFWNAKLRAPICYNAIAVRSYLPLVTKKTQLVLDGRTKAQMLDAIKAAFDKKELPSIESGSMCYMLSKQGYLSDLDGHWHPHLMFFVPPTDPQVWGASLPGSPMLGFRSEEDRMTVFLLPVGKWSDGTAGPPF